MYFWVEFISFYFFFWFVMILFRLKDNKNWREIWGKKYIIILNNVGRLCYFLFCKVKFFFLIYNYLNGVNSVCGKIRCYYIGVFYMLLFWVWRINVLIYILVCL